MKPQELFSVVVKGVGLYFIVLGIYSLLQVLDYIIRIVTGGQPFDDQGRVLIGSYVFAAAVHFVISAWFLKRGDWLLRVAYPVTQQSGRANPGQASNL